MSNIQLARNLRYLRKKYGLTQDELKEHLNISRQAYSNYERCERIPDLDTLVRLAQFYRISLDALVLTNLRTSDASDRFADEVAPYDYRYAEAKETGTSIYLTENELNFIADFRSLSDEAKQILTGFLKSTK